MQRSDSIKELATALAKAQGEMENPSKNATNPHFKAKYADLAEIINTVRPVLAKHGLSVLQLPGWYEDRVTVETVLMHTSGEWVACLSQSPISKSDPQGVGSACTYLRRYSLAAICGIAQEDDDGNSASHSGDRKSGKVQTERQPTARDEEMDKQVAAIGDALRELSGIDAERADAARAYTADIVDRPGVTLDELKKAAATVRKAIRKVKQEAEERKLAGVPADDGDELPFG